MEKTLYIFVTSERPDQYLNPILHCVDNEDVKRIVLVDVIGKIPNENNSKGISDVVLRNIQVLWENLANLGQYRYFIGNNSGNTVDLSQDESVENIEELKNVYKVLLEKKVKWDHLDVQYLELKDVLTGIVKKHPNSLFDITAFDKSMIGDMVSISVVSQIKSINTFDLKLRPDYDSPWNTLYHALKAKKVNNQVTEEAKYKYVNIINTSIFRECERGILLATVPFKLSLWITPLVIIILLIIYFTQENGNNNVVIGVLGIIASVASIWSAFMPFFTPKK